MKHLRLILCIKIIILFRLTSSTLTEVGPCYCGIFQSKNLLHPYYIQTLNYNLCEPFYEEMCNELCISSNTGTVEIDLDKFCEFIGDDVNIYVKLFSKMCEGEWKDTNLSPTEALCCENGFQVVCEEDLEINEEK